jgi:AcrR family transcriptional regulator
MVIREGLRPGGRSARVQESVHSAVKSLLAEMPREAITVAMIAGRAEVTPSTIYRRWGDLPSLLADVAVERFYPDSMPADTGSLKSDLETWAQSYQEEMTSSPGRAMIRDVLAAMESDGSGPACQCADIVRAQVQVIFERAHARSESVPVMHDVLDTVIAPVMYRMLFDNQPLDPAFTRKRVGVLLDALPPVSAPLSAPRKTRAKTA